MTIFFCRSASSSDRMFLCGQLDQTPVLAKLVDLLIRWDADSHADLRKDYERLFWKLPVGIRLSGKVPYVNSAKEVVSLLALAGLAQGKPQTRKYKGVELTRITIAGDKYRELAATLNLGPPGPFSGMLSLLPTTQPPEALYVAAAGEALHISASPDMIRKQIDAAKAEKRPAKVKTSRDSSIAVSLSPRNARRAAAALLDYESHRLALLNNQAWNCFYQTGLLSGPADKPASQRLLRHFLGYVPVSPDDSSYVQHRLHGEVINRRHGSLGSPIRHSAVAPNSDPGRLLDDIRALRVELRFQNNGLHSVLTIER
jgi:hypothetical protein